MRANANLVLLLAAVLLLAFIGILVVYPFIGSLTLQILVTLSSNQTVSAIVGTVIGGIILYFLFGRRKNDSDPILAAAFSVLQAYPQLVSQGTTPPERQPNLHSDISSRAAAFRERIRNIKLPQVFKEQLRIQGDDVSVYLWTRPSIGGIRIPLGTMLTGLTGDLIFAIKSPRRKHASSGESLDAIAIYLPPGFTVMEPIDISQESSVGLRAKVIKTSPYDRFAPTWTLLLLSMDTESSVTTTTVVIRGVTAPSLAGRYFFKIARVSHQISQTILSGGAVDFSGLNAKSLEFIPEKNWPVMSVWGEVGPAKIRGIVRHASSQQSPPPDSISRAGKIWARMATRIDPYTGGQRPDLPCVDAVAYFGPSDRGRYEIEGVAPGVYDLYASASGFPQTLIASDLVVTRGQSLEVDCVLRPGPAIRGEVLTKRGINDRPWAATQSIKVEIYDGPTFSLLPDPSARKVSWSPLSGNVGANQHLTTEAIRPQDVGPHQSWLVKGGTAEPFRFEFGVAGEYGAPRDLDGMVRQVEATWVNGLTTGIYFVRAWVLGCFQTNADGSALQEPRFSITPSGGDITVSVILRA